LETNPIVKIVVGSFTALIAGSLLIASCDNVDEGFRGVELTFGAADPGALDPGIHIKAPVVTVIKQIDVRQRKFEQETTASTKDQQNVQTSIAVNYRADGIRAVEIYSEIGHQPEVWEATIFQPQIQEVLKSVTARYTALELITKRPEVKAEITQVLTERITVEPFIVEQVSITDFTFSEVYMGAIEAKQVAEQEAQRAQNKLDQNALDVQKLEQQAKAEKSATITRAEGDAEALRIQAEAEASYHRAISAAATSASLRHAEIERWDGHTPMYVGEAGIMLPASKRAVKGSPTKAAPKPKGEATPKKK
jgi:regulator of protease activity HflC (stomatin/prohibitin superfamily)